MSVARPQHEACEVKARPQIGKLGAQPPHNAAGRWDFAIEVCMVEDQLPGDNVQEDQQLEEFLAHAEAARADLAAGIRGLQ